MHFKTVLLYSFNCQSFKKSTNLLLIYFGFGVAVLKLLQIKQSLHCAKIAIDGNIFCILLREKKNDFNYNQCCRAGAGVRSRVFLRKPESEPLRKIPEPEPVKLFRESWSQ